MVNGNSNLHYLSPGTCERAVTLSGNRDSHYKEGKERRNAE